MAQKRLLLNQDPRWVEFCRKYGGNPTKFVAEVLRLNPTQQQIYLYNSVAPSRSRTSVSSGHGCFGIDTPIMLVNGSIKKVQDIAINDVLMGDDGKSCRKVLSLNRGTEPMYRFTYMDGTSNVFNRSHILCLVSRYGHGRRKVGNKVKVTVSDWFKWSDGKKKRYAITRVIGLSTNKPKKIKISIKTVEPLGIGQYYGFVLDGNSQFLGGDGTVLHNTGKTSGTSHLVLWHLLCYEFSVTLLTANDMDQMKATIWKEIATNIERIRSNPKYGWIAEHIELLANGTMRIRGYPKTWFVESKTANAKTANKLAGRHGDWLFIIADEASTIPDEVLTTLRGALTGEHNRMLMNSQPTRNAGFFWRTHHELCIANGGDWNNLVFSSLDSHLVSDDALGEMWQSYDNDERRVRLLGLFPQDSSKHMMSLNVAMQLYKRGRIIKDDEPYGYFVTSDIASGEGLRDKSAVVIMRVIGYGDVGADARRVEVIKIPIHTNSIRSNKFANTIMGVSTDIETPLTIVDSGGLGINVCQDLEDASVNVHRVNWGNPCFQNKNKDRYLNLRAQAMHQCARACKEGRVSILTAEYKKDILSQSSRIPKTFSDKGRIRVPPKHSAEWEGMKSPDLWDAICFAFLEGTAYTAVEHVGGTSGLTVAQRLQQEAEDLLEDIE